MHSLVSGTLDRRVVYKGRAYSVRAPLTGEALAILAGVESPTEENILVVDEITRRWLPRELATALLERSESERLRVLYDLVSRGTPEPESDAETPKGDDDVVYRSRDEWEDLVADYMHAFGISARQALEEPWAAFLLFASKISQIYARDQVRYLFAKGLPYIRDDRERRKAYDDLIERGKLPIPDPAKERERKLRKQREWLESLDAEFRIIRHNRNA